MCRSLQPRIRPERHTEAVGIPERAQQLLGRLVTSRRWQLAVAESLTGGQLSVTIARGV